MKNIFLRGVFAVIPAMDWLESSAMDGKLTIYAIVHDTGYWPFRGQYDNENDIIY